MKIKLMVH
jgi:hypothetical protein